MISTDVSSDPWSIPKGVTTIQTNKNGIVVKTSNNVMCKSSATMNPDSHFLASVPTGHNLLNKLTLYGATLAVTPTLLSATVPVGVGVYHNDDGAQKVENTDLLGDYSSSMTFVFEAA